MFVGSVELGLILGVGALLFGGLVGLSARDKHGAVPGRPPRHASRTQWPGKSPAAAKGQQAVKWRGDAHAADRPDTRSFLGAAPVPTGHGASHWPRVGRPPRHPRRNCHSRAAIATCARRLPPWSCSG